MLLRHSVSSFALVLSTGFYLYLTELREEEKDKRWDKESERRHERTNEGSTANLFSSVRFTFLLCGFLSFLQPSIAVSHNITTWCASSSLHLWSKTWEGTTNKNRDIIHERKRKKRRDSTKDIILEASTSYARWLFCSSSSLVRLNTSYTVARSSFMTWSPFSPPLPTFLPLFLFWQPTPHPQDNASSLPGGEHAPTLAAQPLAITRFILRLVQARIQVFSHSACILGSVLVMCGFGARRSFHDILHRCMLSCGGTWWFETLPWPLSTHRKEQIK